MTRAWHANDAATTKMPNKIKKSRQRSTLPHSHPCSTIDAKELNFRVRDGIGCGLFAIITGKIIEVRDRFIHQTYLMTLRLQRGGEVIKPND